MSNKELKRLAKRAEYVLTQRAVFQANPVLYQGYGAHGPWSELFDNAFPPESP